MVEALPSPGLGSFLQAVVKDFFIFFLALTSLAAAPRLCFSASTTNLSDSFFQRYKIETN